MLTHDHDAIVKQVALLIERDSRYGLLKYFTPANDTKTDLVGSFYPDLTGLRKEGKRKFMIEVETPYSFEDDDELLRLQSLSLHCAANNWDFYLVCADEEARKVTEKKIDGHAIAPKAIWLTEEISLG